MKKNCVICGNEFDLIRRDQIACSTACSAERRRNINRERYHKPEIKKRMDLHNKDYRCRPETIKKRKEYCQSPDQREKARKRAAAYKLTPRAAEMNLEWHRKHDGLKRKISLYNQKFFLSLKLGQSVQQTNKMKTTQTEVIKAPTAQEIIQAFDRLMKETKAVCGLLAIACDANPQIFDEIIALDSRFNYNMLESMRKVGKSELYEELLFDPSHNARRLLAFPPKQQEEIYTKPVKIVKQVGGKNIVEEKSFQKLSKHECALVLDESKKRVRTVEEQIGFIKTPVPMRSERYEISGDRLIVLAKTEFTMTALEDILNRMKSKEIQRLVTKK